MTLLHEISGIFKASLTGLNDTTRVSMKLYDTKRILRMTKAISNFTKNSQISKVQEF